MRQHRSIVARIDGDHSQRVPLLPLKNVVIFPRNVVTLLVVRPRSIHAIEEAQISGRMVAVTAHRDSDQVDPGADDLYDVGTLASILSAERDQRGNFEVVLEGLSRVRLSDINSSRPFFTTAIQQLPEAADQIEDPRLLIQHVQELTARYAEVQGTIAQEVLDIVAQATNPGHLADLLASQLVEDLPRRQGFLEVTNPVERLENLGAFLSEQLQVHELKQKISDKVRDQMDKSQREYYLREQLKVIHKELDGDELTEFEQLAARVRGRGLPAYVQDKLLKELQRLEQMPNVSAEATVVRTYVETVLQLPWTEQTEDRIDLNEAELALNKDHFGLESVKERILEFLAVRKLTLNAGTDSASQILCLIGPPGVGKTSLGRSVAEAMGRAFVRVSLGGIRDEAEIRGHRRTYIGAMPGRIITAMKTAGSRNPVIVLDEIDKLASDYRGDPTAAMLEVLDPEQNSSFTDHYLDTPYDLSQVLFITTANYGQQIPRPLRDRMEMIEVSGYTEDEKIEIARRHLLRRHLTASGLGDLDIAIDNSGWQQIIRDYTREAGVRGLGREVARFSRKIAMQIVRGTISADEPIRITADNLEEFLGPRRYGYDQDLGGSQIGLAIGLGTTEIGGEILPVEVATMSGRGSLTITGLAGDIMQESARAAMSYARSRADELRIDRDFQDKLDVHVHLSEGAMPKEGPSAGITMATALISALTRRPVRNDTAMTGEITLRGRVLPIGGFRDKALAAHRHGIKRMIAPIGNEREINELPDNIRDDMEFIFVANMDEVIESAIMLDFNQADDLQDANERSFPKLPPLTPDIVDARTAVR
jgi:ATP-dependent Lon protease